MLRQKHLGQEADNYNKVVDTVKLFPIFNEKLVLFNKEYDAELLTLNIIDEKRYGYLGLAKEGSKELPDYNNKVFKPNIELLKAYFATSINGTKLKNLIKIYEACLEDTQNISTKSNYLKNTLQIAEFKSVFFNFEKIKNKITKKNTKRDKNINTIINYIKRNLFAAQLLVDMYEFILIDFTFKNDNRNSENKNEKYWAYQYVDSEVHDTILQLRGNIDFIEKKGINFGLTEILNVKNNKRSIAFDKIFQELIEQEKKKRRILHKIKQLDICNNQEDILNGNENENENEKVINVKKKIAKHILTNICHYKMTSTAEIIMLYWCLNYKHLTLYQFACRKWNLIENERLNLIESPSYLKSIGQIKNDTENNNKINQILKSKIDKIKLKRKRISIKKTSKPLNKTSSPQSNKKPAKTKLRRCPKGTKQNKITGNCDIIQKRSLKRTSSIKKPSLQSNKNKTKTKRQRCPKGTKRNKITGKCEPK